MAWLNDASHANRYVRIHLYINIHRALSGVGFKLSGQLEQLGLRTVSDLRSWTRPQLVQRFGARIGTMLSSAAWGQVHRGAVNRGGTVI